MKLLKKIAMILLALALIMALAACQEEETDGEGSGTAGEDTGSISDSGEGDTSSEGGEDISVETDPPHTHSFSTSWTAEDGKHYHICECGEKSDEAACTAGSELKFNEDFTKQWNECTVCGTKMNEAEHTHAGEGDWLKDDVKHWQICSACGQICNEQIHNSENMEKTETHHSGTCDVCGETVSEVPHAAGEDFLTGDEYPDKHWNTCAGCGYVMNVEDHSFGTEWTSEEGKHFHACECGLRQDEADCTQGTELKYSADGTKQYYECTVCGGKLNETEHTHTGVGEWQSAGGEHYKSCACGAKTDVAACTQGSELKSDGTKQWYECSVCGARMNETDHTHAYGEGTAGSGEDDGYIIHSCACGEQLKVKTAYTVTDMGSDIAYLASGETNVEIKLPAEFASYEIVGVYLGDDGTNLLAGTPDAGATTVQLNGTSSVLTADVYGIRGFTFEVVGAYDDYSINIPIVAVTDYIESFEELIALRSSTDVTTGYYALKGDIDASDATTPDNGVSRWTGGFGGTIDGRGYSIKNVHATNYGIFCRLAGATVKNIKFTGVNLDGAPLLASVVANTVFIDNVEVEITALTAADEFGVLVSRETKYGQTPAELKNIKITAASGIVIPSVLGGIQNGCVIENVTVTATTVTKIGTYLDGDNAGDFTTLDGVTLNTAIQVDTLAAAEGDATTLVLLHDAFTANAGASVSLNGVTKTVTVSEEGNLTLTLADFGITEMGQYSALVGVGNSEYAFTEIWKVTKVLTQFSDLSLLGNTVNSRNTGYYILGGDIHGEWGTIQGGATTAWNQNAGFGGTFDGRGYTIDRFSVSGYGIFDGIGKGTIKNVNFELVTLNESAPLLARTMYNATVENVTVKLNDYKSTSGECGILVSRQTGTSSILKNITVDANGKDIYNVLGRIDMSTVTVTNYVVNNAGTVTLYGISDSDGTTAITKPDGLTVNLLDEGE